MRTKLLTLSALLVGCTAASRPMFAHHGAVAYERKSVTLKGTVTKFEWNNPHTVLTLVVKDSKGNVEKWIGEASSPNMLVRDGWSRNSLKPGDRISASGHPARDGSKIIFLEKLVLPNGRELAPHPRWPA